MVAYVCHHFSTFDCEILCARLGCAHRCSLHVPACVESGCPCDVVEVCEEPEPDDDAASDLDFMRELRASSPERFAQLEIGLGPYAPMWKRIAVERERARRRSV